MHFGVILTDGLCLRVELPGDALVLVYLTLVEGTNANAHIDFLRLFNHVVLDNQNKNAAKECSLVMEA